MNFEAILFYVTIFSGVIYLVDMLLFAKKRKHAQIESGIKVKPNMLIDLCRSFFPVLLIVLLLRSFWYEPFRIPSGSLKPTLLVGDFILINKYDYGFRFPVFHNKFIDVGEPERGDIAVFYYPANKQFYLIKRIIGLPGDHLSYKNKVLYINGHKANQQFEKYKKNSDEGLPAWTVAQKQENLLGVKHQIYLRPGYQDENFKDLVVPKGMYFALGDNRDDSADSRWWGFVPEANLVGKAKRIFISFDYKNWSVRWNRVWKKIT